MLGGLGGRLKSQLKRAWRFINPLSRILPDFDLSEGWEEWAEEEFGPPPPAGPWRITVDGVFARFHSREHGDPQRLHTLFVDAAEKLAARERFAGYDFISGHFFAAGATGARSEAAHYGIDMSSRFLLEVELELPDVLDFTNYEALPSYINRHVPKSEEPVSPSAALLLLLDQTSGGNSFLTDMGWQAAKEGYRGVRFFGARALDDQSFQSATAYNNVFPGDDAKLYERLRKKDPSPINVVIFFAANVVRYTRRFRVDGGEWRKNPLFGADEAQVVDLYEREGLPSPVAMDFNDLIQLAPSEDAEIVRPNLRRPNRHDS
jgi:hypothetical protein